ncbi:GNAT family N-acetyltransferase [Oryzobacter terrae]|uniref:GNAT family N-acetyltransferase n=1 Tax=Oryzobacter terrae TaxID=1620385 RepID=UPI00366C10C4
MDREAAGSATADAVTEGAVAAFVAVNRDVIGAVAGSRWEELPGLIRYSTGLGTPRFNGVVVLDGSASADDAAAWLDDLARRDLPHCVLTRAAAPGWAADLAAAHDLTTVQHEPFMLHRDPASVEVPERPVLERVDPSDPAAVRQAQQLFADGFEAPVDLLAPLMGREVLSTPGTVAWVGRTDDEPCTVGLGALRDGYLGVFNIATPPAHRRRGLGHAVTARVVAEGVAAGAHTAYLQASELGRPVYEHLGFRTVEAWPSHYPG